MCFPFEILLYSRVSDVNSQCVCVCVRMEARDSVKLSLILFFFWTCFSSFLSFFLFFGFTTQLAESQFPDKDWTHATAVKARELPILNFYLFIYFLSALHSMPHLSSSKEIELLNSNSQFFFCQIFLLQKSSYKYMKLHASASERTPRCTEL